MDVTLLRPLPVENKPGYCQRMLQGPGLFRTEKYKGIFVGDFLDIVVDDGRDSYGHIR